MDPPTGPAHYSDLELSELAKNDQDCTASADRRERHHIDSRTRCGKQQRICFRLGIQLPKAEEKSRLSTSDHPPLSRKSKKIQRQDEDDNVASDASTPKIDDEKTKDEPQTRS